MVQAWLKRWWLDLAVIGGLVLVAVLVLRWREDQFAGYGLKGRYFPGSEFTGKPLRSTLDHVLDFSDQTDEDWKLQKFSAEWTGTIVLPRAGRYVFATESDDGSWVHIGNDKVVDNGGVHGFRKREGVRILKAGPRAIRVRYFQAGAGASLRVSWMPDRRGGLESIPPTLLFPVPPDRVDMSRAHAIPPRDLPSVVILGLSLLAAGLVWGRRAIRAWLGALRRQRWARVDLALCLLLVGGALVLRLWDLGAAGQTWDEDVYWTAGRTYVQSGLSADLRAESWAANYEHPALAKWIYGPASLISEDLDPARTVAAVLGALTCLVVFLLGRDLIGRRVGFIGAALCVVMPHIVAHHKVIGLETPSGLFYTLTLWLFFRGTRQAGNSSLHLLAGLSAGCALATRLTNLSVVLLMAAVYLMAYWREIRAQRGFPLPITLGLMPVAAAALFLGVWPFLWENPLGHLGQMLSHWKPDIYLEFFLGERQEPPWYYFPLYYFVTTPTAVFAMVLLGIVRCGWKRDQGHLTLLLWLLAPFVIMISPMARDGVRYLYPALFATCVVAAAGIDWLATGIGRLFRREALAAPANAVLAVGIGLYALHAGLSVHPYYLDYYNEVAGGPKAASDRRLFEIAWWGEGLKEAVDFIARAAPEGATVHVHAHPTHVVHFRSDLKRVRHAKDADFVIHNNLFNPPIKLPTHRTAYVVRANGGALVWVYQKEQGAKK